MHLRHRISDQLNARVSATMPAAAATVWDKSGIVVIIEQASFKPAGGFVLGGFERLFSVDATVRAEVQTDDLAAMDLGEELVASLLGQPIYLASELVAIGAVTETAAVRLSDMRVIPREARLVLSLTLKASAEVLRYRGPGVVPQDVFAPAPIDGIGEGAAA